MDTSPTLSIGGSRARAALLTTSGTGTGSTDRRVVFLASQPAVGAGHETKTWPHHWSPHADVSRTGLVGRAVRVVERRSKRATIRGAIGEDDASNPRGPVFRRLDL